MPSTIRAAKVWLRVLLPSTTVTVVPLTATSSWYTLSAFTPPGTAPWTSTTQACGVRCPITNLFVATSIPANLKSLGEK